MRLMIDRLSTPIAELFLVSDRDGRIRAVDFLDCETRMLRLLKTHYGEALLSPGQAPPAARRPLNAFSPAISSGSTISRLPLAERRSSAPSWAALRRILAGTTMSYGALAAAVGRPSAIRAVGLAVGSNPVALVVPCHRVIGAPIVPSPAAAAASRASAGCSKMWASSSAPPAAS